MLRPASIADVPIRLRRRTIAVAHREIRRLAAIAEKRAAAAEGRRATPSFRPLDQGKAEAIVGAELLAKVAAGVRRA